MAEAHDRGQAVGARAEAIRAYNECRDLLRRELAVEPSTETEELFREIAG